MNLTKVWHTFPVPGVGRSTDQYRIKTYIEICVQYSGESLNQVLSTPRVRKKNIYSLFINFDPHLLIYHSLDTAKNTVKMKKSERGQRQSGDKWSCFFVFFCQSAGGGL